MTTSEQTASIIETLRGIGILRVSEEGTRAERLASYDDQKKRIKRQAARRKPPIDVIEFKQERNVAGDTPLEQRAFGDAITAVERGDADAILFAYRDRVDRDIIEGAKAIKRMDAADALLLADGKVLTHRTAAQWRDASMASLMGKAYKLELGERSVNGVVERIEQDQIVPFRPGPGFLRHDDGSVEPDQQLLDVIRETWAMRMSGATIRQCREYLHENGIVRSYRSVQLMFKSPLYVGEVHKTVPDEDGRKHERVFRVCDPIIERHVYDAVQAMRVPSGRTAKSDLLLARLNVLRCANCKGRMVGGGQTFAYTSRKSGETSTSRYAFYRCGAVDGDCDARCSISAAALDEHVIEHVCELYADQVAGRASHEQRAREAAERAERAVKQLSAAKRRAMLLDPDADDAEAIAIVHELEHDVRESAAEAQRLATLSTTLNVPVIDVLRSTNPKLLRDRRALISVILADAEREIVVSRGRAPVAERVSFDALV